MHYNRMSFDDTILIIFIANERKKMNEILKMNILSCKYFLLWQTLRKFVDSAFRILGIELFIPGTVWGGISI